MAQIHAASFDRGWSALDFSVYAARDLCIGVGAPLTSFCVVRRSPTDAEVLTVATDPDARGQGRAAAVLSDAAARLRASGRRQLFLEVAEDNAPARALYHRLGFRPIGRRPGYYRRADGRVAAVTYELAL